MDDQELAALRAKRMAELQQERGSNNDKQKEAMQRQQEMKDTMLSALLTQDARARLGRIAAVKPDKAAQFENMLVRLYQSGQIQPKVDEQQLIALLDRMSEATQKPTVKINRRRVNMDSDEEGGDWS